MSVGVRPEKLHLRTGGEAEGSNETNSLEVTIATSTYTGVSTSYTCTAKDGTSVVVYVQNREASETPLDRGASARLTWDPTHTFAVPSAEKKKEQT